MQLIKDWEKILNEQNFKIRSTFNNCLKICNEYNKGKREKFDIGYNIFTLSSDLYYRENFHSDIIKSLLDPKEKHNEGSKYLYIFIELLNKINPNTQIDKFHFENAIVKRERDNIDILITDENSKEAIIIENKINNAGDQIRQIPRYFNLLKKDKYKVEAIVYLTLDNSKSPAKKGWTKEEIKQNEPILKIIPSFDRNGINLFKDWIIPSIIESNNSESLFLLKQYGNLIRHLNINSMDTINLKKFHETLLVNDNLQTTISIKNMLNDLPEYLAIRIEDKYKNNYSPFKKIWRYDKVYTIFEKFELEDLSLKMSIVCSVDGYRVHFTNTKTQEYDIKQNLSEINSILDFEYFQNEKNNIFKTFIFIEEEKLFSFIDKLLEELKQFIN